MISINGTVRIWLYRGVTDMRKSFHGLAAMVRAHFEADVLSGEVFIFLNRRRNLLKALWWDRDGFAIWAKRLERGTFRVPAADAEQVELSRAELSMLLEGITPLRISPRYCHVSSAHQKRASEGQGMARENPCDPVASALYHRSSTTSIRWTGHRPR